MSHPLYTFRTLAAQSACARCRDTAAPGTRVPTWATASTRTAADPAFRGGRDAGADARGRRRMRTPSAARQGRSPAPATDHVRARARRLVPRARPRELDVVARSVAAGRAEPARGPVIPRRRPPAGSGDGPGADVRALLRAEGIDPAPGRITLITNLRVLGYVSTRRASTCAATAARRVGARVVEVHNTHGERHLYTLRRRTTRRRVQRRMAKEFYVSPFIGADGQLRGHGPRRLT